ncbi:Carboxylesterase NlhH [Pigmentiphaga humi]|uniref:Carboxylesterase NlhH n=1 Tax=Pigmentiphaga humi TaxID=2478468 RepID=A0A3P4B247_9BURK|nr:alpha/beta hydrolase [Pigmentiphaga humi]VCU69728.1 Carboxylesterase NlhH [Pigmentiphaga humi]
MARLEHPRPLDPQVADLVARIRRANRPPYWQHPPQAARLFHEKASKVLEIAAAEVAQVRDLEIPVGAGRIGARLYTGMDAPEPAPLLVFAHGGGFTVGSVEGYDAVCRMLANGARCKVLSIGYRLAPEYRFPTAADDVYGAWRWAFDKHAMLGVDPARIAGMGDSAGGTLTAQAALRARDDRLPLAAQVLLYPGTCAWQDTPSHETYAAGYLLDARTIQWFFNLYLRDDADRLDWRFAPLDAPEFAGAAPVLLQLAECDPLVDEGRAYGDKLRAAGVPVTCRLYQGTTHGFYNMGGALRVARHAQHETVDYLRAVFGTSKST